MSYLLIYCLAAGLAPIHHFVLIAFALIWLRYAFWIVSIAKVYPDLLDQEEAS